MAITYAISNGSTARVQGTFSMTSPTRRPAYNVDEFEYADLATSTLGRLLAENGCNIDELSSEIRVLSEDSASETWKDTFGDANHKYAIADDNWTASLCWASSGDWLRYYNQAESEPVEEQLRRLFDWREDQMVLFFRGPCDCAVTNWRTFVRNWPTFFEYDDDGPFVIPLDRGEVLRICPNGTIMKGTASGE